MGCKFSCIEPHYILYANDSISLNKNKYAFLEQLAHALQNGRGHLGPAVLHALARPLGRELDDVFLCVKEHVKLPLAENICIELSLSYHISAGGTSECTKNAEKPPQHFAMRTRAAPRFVS